MSSKTRINTSLRIIKFIWHLLINMAFYLIIIYLAVRVGSVIYDTSYQVFGNEGTVESDGVDVYIKIDQGETTMNVASKLEQNKVIDNKLSFFIHAKLKEYTIMPGIFTLNTSMNYDEIFAVITVPKLEEELEEELEQESEELEQEDDGTLLEEDKS